MRRLLLLFSLVGLLGLSSIAQEFAILNDTVEYTMSSSSGFYFFYPDETMPSNWASPYDYYNGQVYTRYEIISEATDEPSWVQFGIWQDHVGATPSGCDRDWTEQMAEPKYMDGPGSVATNNSSPTTWWALCEKLDFSRVDKFWQMGIIVWEPNRDYIIAPPAYGGTTEIWAQRGTWFPMKIYCTVVAVASGYTFSGWENYMSTDPGPVKPPLPTYSVNFQLERTNKVIPSTDEYSYNANMSDAVTGNGQYLAITPGTDVYFRTKAAGENPASDIQHLVVPSSRPATPTYTVDFIYEETVQSVTSEYEYSDNSNMSSATTGTGTYVDLTPGTSKYFRKKATASAFASLIQTLVVPARPATPSFTISYINEGTVQTVSSEYEYSDNSNMSSAATGSGTYVDLTPGTSKYFRKKATASAFASLTQTLVVPGRPTSPVYTINFVSSKTNENIPSTQAYSTNQNMSGSSNGTGVSIDLVPGVDLYFIVKATTSSFASLTSKLEVPDKPVIVSSVPNPVKTAFFQVTLDFHGTSTGFTLSDLEVTNAVLVDLGSLNIKVSPVAAGQVRLKIIANAINGGNFASEPLITVYEPTVNDISDPDQADASLLLYPSPAGNILNVKVPVDFALPLRIHMVDSHGSVVLQQKMETVQTEFSIDNLAPGLYIVNVFDANGKMVSRKVVKQ